MADPVIRIYSGSTLVAEDDNCAATDAATLGRLVRLRSPPQRLR